MYAVILAGGSGTRLWPWSREQFPKQLISIYEHSLFQETVLRLGGLVAYEDIVVVTNISQKDALALQFQEATGGKQAYFIDEPFGRNTAPAVGLAAMCLSKKDPEAVMALLPSDHHIEFKDRFLTVLSHAAEAARRYGLVTFGIKPDRPETGYGYICCGEKLNDYTYRVDRFVEKPDLAKAREYLQDSRFLWNSGMFVFKVADLFEEYQKYLPEMFTLLQKVNYDTFGNLAEIYEMIKATSIDYGIMEKSDRVVVVPADINWSDIGSWESLYQMLPKDKEKNHIKGNVYSFDTYGSLVLAEKRVVGTVGVKDLIVVDTENAVLVCSKESAQDVKKVVESLKDNNAEEALFHRTVHRPWGSYTVLEEGVNFKVKKFVVKPGERLSLQYHHHRSEHWVVVTGRARVTVDQKVIDLEKNQSTYVPAKALHRVENPGDTPLEIVEVQSGDYLGEDDIVRVEDDYNRS